MAKRALPPLLALALAFPLLSGCLQAGPEATTTAPPPPAQDRTLTTATHALGAFLATTVASFDGTPLHIDVQLPDGPGPFPTLLTDTPYSILGENAAGAAADRGLPFDDGGYSALYVPRGYAVATAHVRGTGESGGCLTIGDPVEGRDGAALVEWIAGQPWSNGKVGMVGTSYDGTTPLETAVWNPPHLATIVPISPVTEWYLYYFERGTHRRNADPFPGSSDTDPALWTAMGVAPGIRTGATGGAADAQCPLQFTLEDHAQDDYNAYWRLRDHHARAGNITAPVLFAHGWQDGNVAPTGIVPLWQNLTAEKRLWLVQGGHGEPTSIAAYMEYQHRWFDHWLLGRDNGALDLPPVVVQDNQGWRSEARWPPQDAAMLRLNLTGDGRLDPGAAAPGTRSYRDDGTGSEEARLEGVNHLTFTLGPLPEGLHLAGAPVLHLRASTDLPGTHFAAKLYDAAPNGTRTYLSRGFQDARHKDSLERGADLVPGAVYEVQWPLHGNDRRVAAGHSLVLVVKSSDDYVVRSPYRATNTLAFGGASWLDVPVVSDVGRPTTAQPATPSAR